MITHYYIASIDFDAEESEGQRRESLGAMRAQLLDAVANGDPIEEAAIYGVDGSETSLTVELAEDLDSYGRQVWTRRVADRLEGFRIHPAPTLPDPLPFKHKR